MNSKRGIALLTVTVLVLAEGATAQTEHFHPKGEPPSKHTIAVLEQSRSVLPFSDTRDFDEQKKGFIADNWFNRGYHGSPEHNSRGVINRCLGYWNANPATLIPLSPADSGPLYVRMMGGGEEDHAGGQEAVRQR